MPLRAYIDDQEILSIEQTDEQWHELKKRLKNGSSLKLPCCNQVGFLRLSSKKLKHFVHLNSDKTCDWKPESPEHLKAKIEIIEACHENGWKAIPEFSDTGWRADVLALQGTKKIAFEVQWSNQTYELTKYRQERYKESNVRGCWFFRTAPKDMRDYDKDILAEKEIPAFKIYKDENSSIKAQLSYNHIPLKTLVSYLLQGKLRFCEHIRVKPKQQVTIVFFETNCWKCDRPQHLWTVEKNVETVCNQDFHLMSGLWNDSSLDKTPTIYEAVKEFVQTEKGMHLKIGELKSRFSQMVQNDYLSHGCFYCDVLFGDFYLTSEKCEGQNNENSIRHNVEMDLGTITMEQKHWCYSENGEFCQ